MIHLRIVVPDELSERVIEFLRQMPSVSSIARVPAGGVRPPGDLVLCDVAREDASVVLAQLRDYGVEERGTIAIEDVETAVSDRARRAEQAATGSPADAVVWEEIEAHTSESAELAGSFLVFMVVATLIAAAGILSDSLILIIGAMVVGPEFGPLAGMCVGLVERRLDLAARSLSALLVGFPLAITAAWLGAELLAAGGRAPDDLTEQTHPATLFISEPTLYSFLVAALAGVAGVLSLTTAKSGALIGVLISVTTIPAAANVGVAAAYSDWDELGGALTQLGVNLTAIVVAGTLTLGLQRLAYARRLARHARRLSRRAARRR